MESNEILEKAIKYEIDTYNLDPQKFNFKSNKKDKLLKILKEEKIKSCLLNFEGTGYEIKERIYGIGGNSSFIYIVCKKQNCNYLLKVQPYLKKDNIPPSHEIKILEYLNSKKNITPKFLWHYECKFTDTAKNKLIKEFNIKRWNTDKIKDYDTLIYILFEKWNGGSIIGIEFITDEELLMCLDKLLKLHKLGIIHNDIHRGNFIYRTVREDRTAKDSRKEFGIIDFGFSWFYKKNIPQKLPKMNVSTGKIIDLLNFIYMLSPFIKGCQNLINIYTEHDLISRLFPKTFWKVVKELHKLPEKIEQGEQSYAFVDYIIPSDFVDEINTFLPQIRKLKKMV